MIITHQNPDFDAIASVWLLKRYYGNLEEESVEFVNTGNPDKEKLKKALAVVDTGKEYDISRLRFDHHHLPGQAANNTCAARQVWEYLDWRWSKGEEGNVSHLLPLIDLVLAGDTGRDAAKLSRDLGIHALLSAFKAEIKERGEPGDDGQILEFGFRLLDLLDLRLRHQVQAQAELDEKVVYKSSDNLVWAIRHGSTGATFAAYEQGARIVVFEGEPIEVEGGTTYPVGIMRAGEWQEPHVGELAERVAVSISKPFADEIRRWYKHQAGFFAGRGTAKAPVLEPVTIDITALANAIDAAWAR